MTIKSKVPKSSKNLRKRKSVMDQYKQQGIEEIKVIIDVIDVDSITNIKDDNNTSKGRTICLIHIMRKKVDSRIRTLIENGVATNHRSFFVIVGDNGKDQVPNLHYILSKSVVKARPSVLWCYKTDLGFSKYKKKKMKAKEKSKSSGIDSVNQEDPFDVFISTTNIRYSYYSESHKILGNTFGMLVLQDFEAITPNLLARTIETVEGGGMVILLLKTMTSLKQLYQMSMDVHSRFRTESQKGDIVARFNERFLLSLGKCDQCIVMDDQLNILPISSSSRTIEAKQTVLETKEQKELKQFKIDVKDTEIAGDLIEHCKTMDQATALLTFINAISDKTLRSTCTLTAGRGRGKSAALGLSIAAAVAFGYSNIFVSSPTPENLNTLFQFIFKGFDALEYQERTDYELVKSTNPEFHDAIIRVNIFKTHRQTIQYIQPQDYQKLGQAELVVIDEAAAIPLTLVKNLLGPYLVFMSSTINGYEGTGRSLSLKLIKQLREQSITTGTNVQNANASISGRILKEVELQEPIRYSAGDPIEKWLNELLCLDSTVIKSSPVGCPHPDECQLYYVNRDTLFSYHKASETFLQKMVGLFVSSHYKNSPNDLLLMSDAPDHHLFVLLGPVQDNSTSLPEILCAVQVSLEGEIAKEAILNSIKRGYQSSGDLIPWTLTQQFQDESFPRLSGCRVVRIATHPDYQKMGYGSKAMELLTQYYQGNIQSLDEDQDMQDEDDNDDKEIQSVQEISDLQSEVIKPKAKIPPLLFKLSERKPEKLQYMGVSYGLTQQLYQFWNRNKYYPVYLRLSSNDITGEHTCIMLREIQNQNIHGWLDSFYQDFRKRLQNLLGYEFRQFSSSMALSILMEKKSKDQLNTTSLEISKSEMELLFSSYDLRRLESYSNNVSDYHVIIDMLPSLAKLYFQGKIKVEDISIIQSIILVALGLQHKNVDQLIVELNLQSNQILSLFSQMMRKFHQFLKSKQEKFIEETITVPQVTNSATGKLIAPRTGLLKSFKGDIKDTDMLPLSENLEDELQKGADEIKNKMKDSVSKKDASLLDQDDPELSEYLIKGDDSEWSKALKGGTKLPSSISIKTQKRKLEETQPTTKKTNNNNTKDKKDIKKFKPSKQNGKKK
ncbi:putative N-acetyltransferase [Tieghemostelium lacteum]|uniref:RNA cytidine acetyltransferase n=1 Tax=Tieghemostelium lacteum TaxID=361077 RepID=A0A151ZGE4_TIELA|nr:putative N-acetyltransferase [Tieghemostelium lacteum]|eukprot:KYQ93042.1 putative N-acetyltransferase [Tieghemostelium lacteum]